MYHILTHPEVRDLPVLEAVGAIEKALAADGVAVLVAPPGAGKTTVVPPVLAESGWLGEGKVVMLEPRRLAARAAAERMGRLLGEDGAGGTVGYRVRGDTRVSRRTRIEVVTEGVLTRMLQSDPALDGVGVVVFDEFHERSVHADLGLALTLHARGVFRPDLRVVVMSATLDAAPVAALLDAPVVTGEGRSHPVTTRWRRRPVEGWIEPAVAATVRRALEAEDGDVLVFLPGAGEIRRTARRLTDVGLPGAVTVHPLFGALTRDEQDRAIAPSPAGRRKVVLATSIAETSITIEGVRVVVDSGLMRVPRFDPGTGMTRLETVRVTRDAADQRRGRAGRTAPGVCYRLWTKHEERGLVPHRRPEMLDADLAPLALELAVWGAGADELRWLDPPPDAAYAQALELLRELDAVDTAGATAHGRTLAGLGVHPRLGHMLVRGGELGHPGLACDLAALLADRDILRGEGRAADADLRVRLEALQAFRRGGGVRHLRGMSVSRGGLRRVAREADRLRRASPAGKSRADGDPPTGGYFDAAGILTALAYPDRVGMRREGQRGRFLLRNGRGARFAEAQTLEGEDWLVAAELEGTGAEARIFRAAPVERAEVEAEFEDQIESVEEIRWDPGAGRVVARRLRTLGALTIAEAPLRSPDPGALGRALLDGIRDAGLDTLPWSKETRQLRDRLEFLGRRDPERWPDASESGLEASLEEWLLPFLTGMRRLGDLRRVDLGEALLAHVGWDRRREVDRLAPTHIEVPSGSRVRIDYSDPDTPALAVRLQEVFGMMETPRIAAGRVPLTVKLLSPAHRPVQVTQDLASFWRHAYFDVRKDLRGRYPRHYWPEDPLRAQATRRTKPREEE
jgi:ATP-dependent helicase HrpB